MPQVLFLNDDVSASKMVSCKDIISSKTLIIAPNPANATAKILLTGYTGNIMIQLKNMEGKLLKQYKVLCAANTQHNIDVSRVVNGMYLVSIVDEKGNIKTEKLVVQH